MAYVLVIAGASSGGTFDLVSKISGNVLAPNGQVIRCPIKGEDATYTKAYVSLLIEATSKCLLKLPEQEAVSVLLLYLNASNGSESMLLEAFFPMALPLSVRLDDASAEGKPVGRKALEALIVAGAQRLRRVYPQVSDKTQVGNLSPLLLPVRNFRSDALMFMLRELYSSLGTHEAPVSLLQQQVNKFKRTHPPTKPPNSLQRCYTDGHLYFKSPGKDRHGFFRNSDTGTHAGYCVIKARSRLGGAIPHTLHYDCTPTRHLLEFYPNCHCEDISSSRDYINIGPSDFVR